MVTVPSPAEAVDLPGGPTLLDEGGLDLRVDPARGGPGHQPGMTRTPVSPIRVASTSAPPETGRSRLSMARVYRLERNSLCGWDGEGAGEAELLDFASEALGLAFG